MGAAWVASIHGAQFIIAQSFGQTVSLAQFGNNFLPLQVVG